jgi:hypothetical protein
MTKVMKAEDLALVQNWDDTRRRWGRLHGPVVAARRGRRLRG